MRLAIIPARGGSKRIPRKNVMPFGGKPMLCWSVEAALETGLFSDVVVSTDDLEIAATARRSGASTPFERPASLADDHTPMRDVLIHAIEEMERLRSTDYESVCCILATAPFVSAVDLRLAEAMLTASNTAQFVFSAATFAFPIQRALKLSSDGGVEMLRPKYAKTRSQDLPEAFHDAGQFYWGRKSAFLSRHPMYSPQSLPYMLPRSQVQDIDTPEDWEMAEQLFALRRRLGEA